jgi:hypothetical protein
MKNITSDLHSLQDYPNDPPERLNILSKVTRTFAREMLNENARAEEISYALCYVATEQGLLLTNNSFKVFTTALSGQQDAGTEAIHREKTSTTAKVIDTSSTIVDNLH